MPQIAAYLVCMTEENYKAITPGILTAYFNLEVKNLRVTISEFRGFTDVNERKYLLVLNYMDNCDRSLDFISYDDFNCFLIKKRFQKMFGC